MTPTRRGLLGTAAAAVALAGCVTDDGDGDGDTGGDGATDEPTATDTDTETTGDESTPTGTGDGGAPTVQVRSHPDLGDVLVGPEELTLYMFDQDTQGESASSCYEGCADSWPPLTVDGEPTAGDDVAAELTTFERDDGETQVAANGWPLYYFAGDEAPGDASGQGLNDVWWVLDPAGEPVRDGETPTATEEATATAEATETETDGGSAGGY